MTMKLNQIQTHTISEASAADLDASFAAFVATIGEATYVDMQFIVDAGTFNVIIIYQL